MKQFLGKYRGIVVDNRDPEKRGRIRASCPTVYGDTYISPWALPCLPPNVQTHPQIGDLVWMEFEGGERDLPIWTGVFYTRQQFKDLFGTIYNTRECKFIAKDDFLMVSKYENFIIGAEKDFRTRTLGINDLD